VPPIIGVLGALVVSPRTAFRIIEAEKRSVAQSLFLVLLVAASLSCSFTALIESFVLAIPFIRSLWWPAAVVVVASGIVAILLDWLIISLLSHIFARLLGGGGSLEGTMRALGFSSAIFFFVPLLMLTIQLLAPSPILIGVPVFFAAIVVGAVWWLIVAGIGLSEAHEFSGARGLLSVVLAFLVILVVVFAFPVLVGG